ncbi:CLUMA_CG011287, isoform A [Clunio marinus]|uniref:CLUMA_CG011287, isoform A n=1 Tax=Clunio marinus TaxID=568069 RepID=A0A1J1ICF7_9DIPT|nr:CLUMA_CG011287, isoform A [Clunio marinus]
MNQLNVKAATSLTFSHNISKKLKAKTSTTGYVEATYEVEDLEKTRKVKINTQSNKKLPSDMSLLKLSFI